MGLTAGPKKLQGVASLIPSGSLFHRAGTTMEMVWALVNARWDNKQVACLMTTADS